MFERLSAVKKEEIRISKDVLDIWRKRIFSSVFISALVAALIPYFLNLKIAMTTGQFLNAVIYTAAYAIAVFVTFGEIIPFKIRAWTGLLLFYLIGIVSLTTIGPAGSGRIWLFVFAVMTTLILGLRAGIISLLLNMVTVTLWIWGWSDSLFTWNDTYQFLPNQVLAMVLNFLFMNTAVTISLGIFVSASEKGFENGQELSNNLKLANEELIKENKERKNAQEALRESEKIYRSLFENTGTATFITEEDMTISQVNVNCFELSGYSKEEIERKMKTTDFAIPDEVEKIRKYHDERRKSGGMAPVQYEMKIMTKQGKIKDVIVQVGMIPNTKRSIVSIIDITHRKKADETILREQEKFKVLVEESPLGVSLMGENGGYKYINPTFTDIFGYCLEDIPNGKAWFQKAYPDQTYRNQVISVWINDVKRYRTGQSRLRTFTVRCKDDSEKMIHFRPVTLESGEQLVIYEDITERKNLEAQLQQAQKMESIGTLAGGIAHDFNNILSPIMIHSEMAMEDLPPDSPLQTSMREIYKAGQRARDLVKQILTFARKRTEARVILRASLIVKEAVKFLRSTIPTTIDIHCDCKAKQDTVLADPTQINQIVMNLCTNAAQAMRAKGGLIEIILDDEYLGQDKPERFMGLNPGRYLKLSVRDTGPGIPPDIREKIFEPYFTTNGPGGGTGLGLSIVHGITKTYGGDVIVESEEGQGTAFHVYLPVIEEELSDVKEKKDELPRGNERILFVDDEKAAVNVMETMLERLGYKVTARTSSVEALEAFRNKPQAFDLVITDMTMPSMTGKELAVKLRSLRSDMPIILCTGFSDQIDEIEAKRMGISAFVMKPIVMIEIANTIRKVLDKKLN